MNEIENELPESNDSATVFDIQSLIDSDLDGLLDTPVKPKKATTNDRLERAFLEIVEFRKTNDRLPSSTTRDIAERKLGARLEGILANEEKVSALKHLDEFGMLEFNEAPESLDELLNDDGLDLLDDELGLYDVSDLPEKRKVESPDSVATRKKAIGFDAFEPLFKAKHAELVDGTYQLVTYPGERTIDEGQFFVLNGVMLFVAEVGESMVQTAGRKSRHKQRLRVIFENGTESSMYRQSLSVRLHEGEGQLLARTGHDLSEIGDADEETGHIYVLRSLSSNSHISSMQNLYKIGFSTTTVEQRIANAKNSPTYLMAPVEIVADYRAYNLRTSALEHLVHRVFASVRLDITQIDRAGKNYDPSEWFIAPLNVINQAINMIMSGEISDYMYDAQQEKLVSVSK
ncbi:GIY-YIG nuclease family protein [Glutamicibacter arilaitensis]|uniref:GIY-YIG nuclease family protein n=1 Tax=Glutamicibacter arilaitensis TaxID=256701 RepID=UPI003FD38C9E